MDLLVDPVLYAVPSANGNSDAHIQFVESLIRWNEEIRKQQHNFFVWFECIAALSQANCYPDHQNINQLWRQVNEGVISPDLAARACKRLLDRPYLDDWLKDPSLDEMIVDESNFSVRPDLLQRLPSIVADAFQETLGKIAYIKEVKKESPVFDLHLITHPVAGDPVVEISAHVVTEEQSAEVNTDLPLIFDPNELDALQDLNDLWPNATEAIQWLAREMIRQGHLPDTTELAPFVVNSTFVASIEKYHFEKKNSRLYQIIRKCVLLLSSQIPPDPAMHHTLDKHKQRFCGNWGAWRLHITGSHLAIRLHYWRHMNRHILMHVVPHENMKIDDPPAGIFD